MKTATKQKFQAATAAAKALRSLSYSSSARRDIYLAGGIPLLTRLTLSIGGDRRETHQHRTASVVSPSAGPVNTKPR